MADIAKFLVIAGVLLVVSGAVIWLVSKSPMGRLPGDIVVHRKNFTLAFPLATSILISVVLTLLLWILSRFRH